MDDYLNCFSVDNYTKAKFERYYELLVQENEKYNLTAITKKDEVYIKHFFDSLYLQNIIPLKGNLCDIGSGAGFPGIPLAIMNKDLHVTIIEPTLKRIKFLNLIKEELELDNVTIICKRAEDILPEERDKYLYVTARAVSKLNILLELLTPYVAVNGYLFAYKGMNAIEELKEAKTAIKELSLDNYDNYEYDLPYDFGKRFILGFKKSHLTSDKYPRKYSIIIKKPL